MTCSRSTQHVPCHPPCLEDTGWDHHDIDLESEIFVIYVEDIWSNFLTRKRTWWGEICIFVTHKTGSVDTNNCWVVDEWTKIFIVKICHLCSKDFKIWSTEWYFFMFVVLKRLKNWPHLLNCWPPLPLSFAHPLF